MAIWILALGLLLALVAIGYTQGVIKVAFTTLGLLVGGLLAMPLAGLVHKAFKVSGGNVFIMYAVSPVIVFALVMVVFKAVGFSVHHKIESHFKYKTSELRQTMWRRLSDRAGAVLSAFNALGYLIFLCVIISVLGYPAYPLASGEKDDPAHQLLLKAVEAVEKTQMNKVAAAFDPTPAKYYDVADTVSLLYRNPLAIGRFARYPALLAICEKPEYVAISGNKDLFISYLEQKPIKELLSQEHVFTVVTNADLVNELLTLDFKDLKKYLETGETTKFGDEPIMGHWEFDLKASLLTFKKLKPDITVKQVKALEAVYGKEFPGGSIVATLDKQIFLKVRTGDAVVAPIKGTWESTGNGQYKIAWPVKDYNSDVVAETDRLIFKKDKLTLIFERQQ